MKTWILSVLVMVLAHGLSRATIITVDNNYPSLGQFTTLSAAHNAATPGDTIYVFPSDQTYAGIPVTKKLILIGAGFEAPPTVKPTRLGGTMTFDPGSEGSSMEGFGSWDLQINVNADNISIKRNYLSQIRLLTGHFGTVILQNHIENCYNSVPCIEVFSSNEALIMNNKVISCYYVNLKCQGSSISLMFSNNVFNQTGGNNVFEFFGEVSATFINNILVNGYFYNVPVNNCFNNMSNGGQFPSGNGNMQNVVMDSVFMNWQGKDYHLKPGSPAYGTGQNGTDMGIYSGATPFVDNGYPGIPCIYYLDVPLVGNQQSGINVTIKAKSNPQ